MVAVALAAAALICGGRALAWDDAGHMQVADIAWSRLNDRAKREVGAILMAADPRFRPATVAEADVRAAFRKSATFPDYIKFTKDTIYENDLDAMNRTFFVVKPPDPKDNEDVRCKTWHYYDVALHDRGVHPPKESNALNALSKARYEITALEATAAPDRRLQNWWLVWIEHITGDLHQPLHCVSNFESLPNGDAGGNLFMIKTPGSARPGRLHGYWDGGISRAIAADKAQGLSPSAVDVSQRWQQEFPASTADAADTDVMSWIDEGAALADTVVYVGIEKDQEPSKGYTQLQTALCKRQAVLGGARLAAILNETLGK
jgi:hypothetical protein